MGSPQTAFCPSFSWQFPPLDIQNLESFGNHKWFLQIFVRIYYITSIESQTKTSKAFYFWETHFQLKFFQNYPEKSKKRMSWLHPHKPPPPKKSQHFCWKTVDWPISMILQQPMKQAVSPFFQNQKGLLNCSFEREKNIQYRFSLPWTVNQFWFVWGLSFNGSITFYYSINLTHFLKGWKMDPFGPAFQEWNEHLGDILVIELGLDPHEEYPQIWESIDQLEIWLRDCISQPPKVQEHLRKLVTIPFWCHAHWRLYHLSLSWLGYHRFEKERGILFSGTYCVFYLWLKMYA